MDVLEQTDVASGSSPEPQLPAATDAAEPNNDVETFSDVERTEWLKTGNVPTKQTKSTAGASGASDNREPRPGAPDAEPSHVSTGESAQDKEEYKAKTAQRFNELLQRNREYAAEIAALRAQVNGNSVRQDPRPEPVQPAAEDPKPVKPVQSDFSDWDEYENAKDEYQDAMSRWNSRQEARQLLKADEQAKQARAERLFRELQQQQSYKKFSEIEQSAANEYPDYDAVVTVAENAIRATPNEAIIRYVTDVDNPNAAKVFYHLGKNPSQVAEIAALPVRFQQHALARIEESLSGQHSPQVPVKHAASAPPPPTYLSGNKTAPVDEKAEAVRAGDFTRYMQLANAEDMAKRRR